MSSYDEHLITQAGGDGDMLTEVEARLENDKDEYAFAAGFDQSIRDRGYLLALVREQAAKLKAVREMCEIAETDVDGSPRKPFMIHPNVIRAALESKP